MNLKKIGKIFTIKFVGTGPSSYKKRIYRAAVSQRLRNIDLDQAGKLSMCVEVFVVHETNPGSRFLRNIGNVRDP